MAMIGSTKKLRVGVAALVSFVVLILILSSFVFFQPIYRTNVAVPSGTRVVAGASNAPPATKSNTLFDGLVGSAVVSSLNYFSPDEYYYIVSELYQPFATYLYPPGNKLEGVLGNSWSHNANYTVWYLTLKKGLRWDNGAPLNSTDLWFSLMVYNQIGFFSNYNILSISIVNSTTVEVRSGTPQPNFVTVWATDTGSIIVPYQSFHPYDANVSSSNVTALFDFTNLKNIVADGPFIIRNYTVGKNPILFTANPYFYRGRPSMDYLAIEIFSSVASAATSLRSGGIEVLWDLGPYNTVIKPDFEGIPGTNVYKMVPAAYMSVELNMHLWPYNTTQFRMALAYLTNRTEINDAVNEVNGSLVGYNLLPPSLSRSIGVNPSTVANYTYNVSKAEELLAKIGIEKDNNPSSPNYGFFVYNNSALPDYGSAVVINITTAPNVGFGDVSTSVLLSSQWQAAGFKVTIQTITLSSFLGLISSNSSWDVAVQLLDTIAPTASATISSTELSYYSSATDYSYPPSFGLPNYNFSYITNLSNIIFEYPFGSNSSNIKTAMLGNYLASVVPTIPLWPTYNWVVASNMFYWGNQTNHTGLFSTQTLSMEPLWSGTLYVVHPLHAIVSHAGPSIVVYAAVGVVVLVIVVGVAVIAYRHRKNK